MAPRACECGCGGEVDDEVDKDLQWLIEEALLERLELEDAFQKAREAEQAESQEAVEGSLRRREQAELALQRTGAG